LDEPSLYHEYISRESREPTVPLDEPSLYHEAVFGEKSTFEDLDNDIVTSEYIYDTMHI
jgi:hypothetical protein